MKADKSVEETFVKKTQLEHIIDIPDTYIGSIEKTDIDTWIYDDEAEKIIYKNIKYIPGLYKIFDEVLVNAIDQHVRVEADDKIVHKVCNIKVNFDMENYKISVFNDGEGIPIVEHKEHGVYVPELIFGHLLTSSNYDKNEKKITGGKNGYGAKLANIFSKSFRIETVDAGRGLKYEQLFEKNMNIKNAPKITKSSAKPYTIIEFCPDLDRFGIDKIDEDTLMLMKKRVIDITACTNKNVSVYINDKKLDCKTMEKYVNFYLDNDVERVYEEVSDRWEVVVAINPDTKFEQVSFVNGISTIKGGKHVDYVANAIIKKVQNHVLTKGVKRKKMELKPAHIKDNLFIFIRCTVENPAFDSQIKEYLTTPSTKFGSKCEVSDKFIEKLIKTSLIDRAMKLSDFKDNIGLLKVSGKKTTSVRGIDKLDDANKAGSVESQKCTLILTEGDSAKALAIAGLSVVGRDYFGVFPLRGKVLNVRDVNLKKVSDNNEISSLVKIMGLKYNTKKGAKSSEETMKDLRYGKIMIFTDADVDGSHIKGLLINLFATFWPELLNIPGFIITLATPILKVRKNKDVKEFYTMSEFNVWKESIENVKTWDIKYYKGLGTSTSEEAKGYFTDFIDKIISYEMTVMEACGTEDGVPEKNICTDKIELAFDKKRSDDRKMWLKTYDKDNILEQTQKKILYNEFIDKELIHFSNYDNERSIPSLCDGLKPSQRKIIYGCFKRNLKKEIKVAQLAGYISENSAYHHGEQSLYDTIIGLAQDFVGANNIELLEPKGQFGTRINSGGKDAASPRYIFTNLSELTFHIFNPLDNPILEYNEDDGKKIEPVWYIPILPLVLINGTEGIGTGFSTKIPPHDPEIIVRNLLNLLDDKPMENTKPWFRGFKGAIDFKGVNDIGVEQYINKGKYQIVDDSTMIITELPIGKWTDDYKFFLESLLYDKTVENKGNKQCLMDFSNNSTEKTINFTLKFKREDLKELHQKDDIESVFKLTDTKYTNYSNMHLYNSKGTICKYDSVGDIMKEFYVIRLAYYTKRKEYMLKSMRRELDIYEAKIRFIEEFISGTINILHKEDEEVEEQLMVHNFPKFGKESDEGDSDGVDGDADAYKMSYDYLLNMKIKSLTKKKIEELKKLFENKMAVYNELMAKDEKTLWRDDLNNFLDVYRKKLKVFNEKMDESGKAVVKAKNIKVSVKKGTNK